jgi:hypothetical protein
VADLAAAGDDPDDDDDFFFDEFLVGADLVAEPPVAEFPVLALP